MKINCNKDTSDIMQGKDNVVKGGGRYLYGQKTGMEKN